ncbi:MAG: hypothetical protein WAM70_03655, partial [Pyrinomonadaceae bacterium]
MKLRNLIKPSAVALGCAGASVAAPFLAPYLATASIPFFGTVFAGLFRANDFQEGLGKVIVNTASGILANLGSSAIEQLPSALASEHNFHLEIMLATAYLDSLAEAEKEIRVGADEQLSEQAARIIPLLKVRIERGLRMKEPSTLFLLQIEEHKDAAFANRFSAEEFSLSVAVEEKWGEQLGEEVDIALRRWLGEECSARERAALQTQLGLTTDAPLPEPLRSYLRAKLPNMIAHGISEMVKRPEFTESWIAFQRAHLQGMWRIVEGIQTYQADISSGVNALARRIEGFANSDVFVEAVANKLEEFLRSISVPQDRLAQLLERQRAELSNLEEHLSAKIDQSTERLSTESKENTAHLADKIGAVGKKVEEAIRLSVE